MATKNSRNARLLFATTLNGPYTAVTKSHGLKFNVPTDFRRHRPRRAVQVLHPWLQDFKLTLLNWYDTIYTTLEAMSLNKISEYFIAYIDFADTLNYYRGQMYVGQDEVDLDLGVTVGEKFTGVIANADIQVVRAGAAL
jgi:hypothetical protein